MMSIKVLLLINFLFCKGILTQVVTDVDCESCTQIAESAIETIKKIVKNENYEPFKVIGTTVCSNCEATGITTMKLTEGKTTCEYTTADGAINEFFITLQDSHLTCDCEFPCDPVDLVKLINNVQGQINSTIDCPLVVREDSVLTPSHQKMEISLVDLLKLDSCRPGLSVNGLNQGLNGLLCTSGTTSGRIGIEWPGIEITFNTTRLGVDRMLKPGGFEILNKDLANLTVKCGGNNKIFTTVCNCLSGTTFFRDLIYQLVSKLIVGCDFYTTGDVGRNYVLLTKFTCQ